MDEINSIQFNTYGSFQISEMDFHDSALMVGFSEAMIKELQQV